MIKLNKIRHFQEYSLESFSTKDHASLFTGMVPAKKLDDYLVKKEDIRNAINDCLDKDKDNLTTTERFKQEFPVYIIYPKFISPNKFQMKFQTDLFSANTILESFISFLYDPQKWKTIGRQIDLHKKIIFNYHTDKNTDYTEECITLEVEVNNIYLSNGIAIDSYYFNYIHHMIMDRLLENHINVLYYKDYCSAPRSDDKYETNIIVNNLKLHLYSRNANDEELSLFVNYAVNNLLEPMLLNFGGHF